MGGGQLLGNDDDVMVPPGSGLPVGNSCKRLQCIVFMRYVFLKKNVTGSGKKAILEQILVLSNGQIYGLQCIIS